MSLTNPATAHLRIPGAPATGHDVDMNRAIVQHVADQGPRSLAQLGDVFLPAAAAGCNRDDQRAFVQRLTYLCATGHLQRTGRGSRVRYHLPHHHSH